MEIQSKHKRVHTVCVHRFSVWRSFGEDDRGDDGGGAGQEEDVRLLVAGGRWPKTRNKDVSFEPVEIKLYFFRFNPAKENLSL